jgi:hypothetical protein
MPGLCGPGRLDLKGLLTMNPRRTGRGRRITDSGFMGSKSENFFWGNLPTVLFSDSMFLFWTLARRGPAKYCGFPIVFPPSTASLPTWPNLCALPKPMYVVVLVG